MSLLPQFGFIEMVVIAIVTLIVVKPKDLPRLMRTIGQTVAKAKRMAGEFTSAFDDIAHEAEMDELRKEMEALRFDKMAEEIEEEIEEAVSPIKTEFEEAAKSGEALSKPALSDKAIDQDNSSKVSPKVVDTPS